MTIFKTLISGCVALFITACVVDAGSSDPIDEAVTTGSTEQAVAAPLSCSPGIQFTNTWTQGGLITGVQQCSCDGTLVWTFGSAIGTMSQVVGPSCTGGGGGGSGGCSVQQLSRPTTSMLLPPCS